MLRFSLATLLLASVASANEPPPEPEGGLVAILTAPCTDMETGEKGVCYVFRDVEENYYTAFWQGETLQFIRRPLPDGGYESVWVNDRYNSY